MARWARDCRSRSGTGRVSVRSALATLSEHRECVYPERLRAAQYHPTQKKGKAETVPFPPSTFVGPFDGRDKATYIGSAGAGGRCALVVRPAMKRDEKQEAVSG